MMIMRMKGGVMELRFGTRSTRMGAWHTMYALVGSQWVDLSGESTSIRRKEGWTVMEWEGEPESLLVVHRSNSGNEEEHLPEETCSISGCPVALTGDFEVPMSRRW